MTAATPGARGEDLILPERGPILAQNTAFDQPILDPASVSAPILTPAEGAVAAAGDAPAVASEIISPEAPESAAPATTPSESVTINLISKLVDRGILTKEDADGMIKQAQAEAVVARAAAQADMIAIAQAAATEAAIQEITNAQSSVAPTPEDMLRVAYVPEPVKTQIKEDIKSELLADSRGGKWVFDGSDEMPEWVSKFRPHVDFRFRYEGVWFPADNDATGAFPNFNSINTGAPYDVTGFQFAPQYNVDADRNRFRLRLRAGAELELADGFTAGVRIATGENNSPVTTNQTVGLANQGQGGNFSKYALWLDRAFVRWEAGETRDKSFNFTIGRFDNPFFGTSMIWDDDLGFDGIAVQGRYKVADWLTPWGTVGVFPVFNTDFNFSSVQPVKYGSYDKYLYGGQVGFDIKPAKDWNIKVAGAYYYFQNVEGRLSTPFTPLSREDAGDTDNSRPSFAQKGNTYMPLRRIIPDASNDFGAINQWQYYGLATKFQNVAATMRIDYNGFEPVQVSAIAEYVRNLSFDKNDIEMLAVNNRGTLDETDPNSIGAFDGSGEGWLFEMRVGTPTLSKRGDWYVGAGYRWIGSDSVVDGFNDSDFGLGGTNMEGFTASAAVSLTRNVSLALRWMAADNIAGPTFKTNILQFEFNSKF